MSEATYKLFASCPPGLEPFLATELSDIHLSAGEQELETGGVGFTGTVEDIYKVNLHSRLSTRLLVRMGDFYAVSFPELKRKTTQLNWLACIKPDTTVAFRVTCHKSRLHHSTAISERVGKAIADSVGYPIEIVKPASQPGQKNPLWIMIRFVRNRCQISMDSSGELLHRRGYRQATTRAVLRETLAAAMIRAAGWDKQSPLVDPFCGSGTIAIEAAMLASGIPPGNSRRFAFMEWPAFDKQIWQKVLSSAESSAMEGTRPLILASDRDEGAIRIARENAQRAGVLNRIEFVARSLSDLVPPADRGSVVTNPPYGIRVGGGDLRNLYARFGDVLRRNCAGWRIAVLSNNRHHLQQIKLPFDRSISLDNGGVRVKLVTATVPDS